MMQRGRVWRGLSAGLAAVGIGAAAACAQPMAVATATRLPVAGPQGQGMLPIYLSDDWSRPLPLVTRAVIAVHDSRRDAAAALAAVDRALVTTGASSDAILLIAPRFETRAEIVAHGLPADTLDWDHQGWKDGSAALGPAPLSSFDALDAVLTRLAEPTLFPALRQVVVAGHSAGGQMVQRYAVAGRGEARLAARRIGVRYVVANPSSYVWFGEARPNPVDRIACPNVDQWKYGLAGAPPYVGPTEALEMRYIARDVVYLLGELDTDPNQSALDRSCAAEAQGASRYARGMQYLLGLELRHPNLVRHRILSIPNVGHDGARMFGSACGISALFDRPGCPGL